MTKLIVAKVLCKKGKFYQCQDTLTKKDFLVSEDHVGQKETGELFSMIASMQ